jgi:hypothetical protein
LNKLKRNIVLNAAVDCTGSTEGHHSRQGKSIKTRNEKRRRRCIGYCNGCIAKARLVAESFEKHR